MDGHSCLDVVAATRPDLSCTMPSTSHTLAGFPGTGLMSASGAVITQALLVVAGAAAKKRLLTHARHCRPRLRDPPLAAHFHNKRRGR